MTAMASKTEIIEKFKQKEGDTGSPEVQVALLTARIQSLTEHLSIYKKDNHCRQGLRNLVSKRRSLLDYIKRLSLGRYKKLIDELKLRN